MRPDYIPECTLIATDCLPSSVLIASLIRYDEFEKSKHSPEAVKAATEEVYQLHASVHHGAFASPQVQRELEEQAEAAAARKDLHPSAQKVVTKE